MGWLSPPHAAKAQMISHAAHCSRLEHRNSGQDVGEIRFATSKAAQGKARAGGAHVVSDAPAPKNVHGPGEMLHEARLLQLA